ncbi:MAG: divergent PAP2 family protein [Candidatus Pacebacteria bacterium]|nr:divergent PAP2 family protein [Candidatus Paceibacterota bacterium]MDR3583229.1 divergent PAP2 family protein [Candidatus Paceibacterota bacterium]
MFNLSKYLIFLVPIAVWFIVQGIKFLLFSMKYGWDIRETLAHVSYGHMPSAHTGFVTALVTSVGWYDGLSSGAFAVALILAIMTIDDSIRLRMYIGSQGMYFNRLVARLNLDETEFPKLKERMGHRVDEVIVGGILGFLFTILLINLLSH